MFNHGWNDMLCFYLPHLNKKKNQILLSRIFLSYLSNSFGDQIFVRFRRSKLCISTIQFEYNMPDFRDIKIFAGTRAKRANISCILILIKSFDWVLCL